MPLTLANPDRLRHHPPKPPSRSSSGSSQDPGAPVESQEESLVPGRLSLHSSSSDHTAVEELPKVLGSQSSKHHDDTSPPIYKTLPAVPLTNTFGHKAKHSDDYDSYAVRSTLYASEPVSLSSGHPLTSISRLAAVLGPDNVLHTAEIATLPCAGIRISHGPLSGLLAWRLVVSNPTQIKTPRRRWGTGARQDLLHPPPTKHSKSYSEFTETEMKVPKAWAGESAISLPMKGGAITPSSSPEAQGPIPARPKSAMTVFTPHECRPDELQQSSAQLMPVVVTNFILDTSLPYSIVSRETLLALGYSPERLPSPHSDPHALEYNETEESRHSELIVSLSVQGVTTRVRIARPGEASRLGVQYLRDASVSVFFPRNGDGVGPVLYYESARLLRDIPPTVTALPHSERTGKSLPQLVRSLFGLSS